MSLLSYKKYIIEQVVKLLEDILPKVVYASQSKIHAQESQVEQHPRNSLCNRPR